MRLKFTSRWMRWASKLSICENTEVSPTYFCIQFACMRVASRRKTPWLSLERPIPVKRWTKRWPGPGGSTSRSISYFPTCVEGRRSLNFMSINWESQLVIAFVVCLTCTKYCRGCPRVGAGTDAISTPSKIIYELLPWIMNYEKIMNFCLVFILDGWKWFVTWWPWTASSFRPPNPWCAKPGFLKRGSRPSLGATSRGLH